MVMRFSRDDVQRFAIWSGDVNPLHMDVEHARQTYFGQPIVHGVLTVLGTLESADRAALRAARGLDIEFRGAVVVDRDYAVESAPASDGMLLTLRGSDGPVLSVRVEHGDQQPDVPELQPPRVGGAGGTLRDTPAAHAIDELRTGIEHAGIYPPDEATEAYAGRSGLGLLQARVLALCSYVTGMEVPGLKSLFARVHLRCHGDRDHAGPLAYRARTIRFDPHFRLLDTQLGVTSASGALLATALLRSYVPFSPNAIDLDALASRLAPATARLQGKVALVCGGSRGLGAEIAATLALAGCQVYAGARRHDAASGSLQRALAERGGRLELLEGDAGDPEWCQTTLDRLQARHGRLDLLVLNACAPPVSMRIGRDTARRHDAYVRENLRLVDVPLSTFLSTLNESRGAAAFVSSSFAADPPAGFAHYVAVKQAGEALVRTAARELPAVAALIARPPMLQTRWNDTPTGVAGSMPSDWAASHIVNRLADGWRAGHTELLSEFPAFTPSPSKADARPPDFTLRVAATFTTDALLPSLRFWLNELGINGRVEAAPYGQVLQSLLDPKGLFEDRSRGANVILVRVRDWLRELSSEKAAALEFVRAFLDDTARDFERAVKSHRAHAASETLLVFCPSYGGLSSAENILLRQVETDLTAALGAVPGLTVVSAVDYHPHYRVDEDAVGDPLRDQIAHIPYRDGYLHTLATIVARRLHRRLAPARKVVVVDCDNTLWRGVVGEAGAEGLEIDEGHRALQATLARLARSGVLVCLCSKNEEADVWRVFDMRDDLSLRREQIVAAMVNWQPKSENLRTLAARLNLGLDSFVFIDDNPVECAEVRARCPEVLTLQWPLETERALRLLEHVWEFDDTTSTKEDQRRTEMYREEFRRQELKAETLTFDDFINSLGLIVDIEPLAADDLRRSSQLTLRTNQFNFTTIRREESELQQLADGGRHEIRTIKVRDRFGDYGLVGLVIVERGADAWMLDTFLLSCRVLGRGVEHRVASEVGRLAGAAGARIVTLRVELTKRNTPAQAFLQTIAPAQDLRRGDRALECDMPANALAAVCFEPTAGVETPIQEESERAGRSEPIDNGRLRRREEQIARAAFELSTAAGLQSAIESSEGKAAPGVSGVSRATDGPRRTDDEGAIADIVCAAFASALRMPLDTVRQVDRLEDLGCDSLRIVEITVALSETFPSLPSTLLFEHRSVSQIVREIERLSTPAAAPAPAPRHAVAGRTAPSASPRGTDVAVVGLHLRCAGASSPDELWDLLSQGRTAVKPVPADRRHFLQPLRDTRPHWAGLLSDAGRFDAEFFGVSPREAEYMDPQLRLFLEVAWSALEDAGCAGAGHDADTGVFAGVMYSDYGLRANHGGAENPYRCWEGFSLANRLSQLLGFEGPSIAVDTACSSSGTALHLACRALAAGDCRAAVVGGVNLILDSDRFASLGRLGILSMTGRCEPFGADADGTVLGEGAGVVVLRPLADALERGDRIYGVIRGTALSTGSGTVGFTAPNPQAQADAIRRSVQTAGIDPRTITYVETHGTGTGLGDPIEVRGLTLAYTSPDLYDDAVTVSARCRLGSIKPNIGHLEAGAGVLGLIKVLLQMQHGTLAPSMTSRDPNPQIPFARTPFEVQRTLEAWDRPVIRIGGIETTVPRRAGLSSFGVGGANAHVIVEEGPFDFEGPAPKSRGDERTAHVFAISARSEQALNRRVEMLARFVEANPGADVADVAFSLSTGRRHFPRRLAIVAGSRDELRDTLRQLGAGRESRRVVRGAARQTSSPRQTAFLFTGQGSQYAGMGKPLYATQPVFRDALDRCAAIFDTLLNRPLFQMLFAEEGSPEGELLNQTGYTQPALFAFEYALAELWRSWGVMPDLVMGHSVGEIAAICVAGGVSLEDGLKLIAARGRLMQALPAGGTMTSVMAPEDRVLEAIAGREDLVAIAAINSPQQVVISGVGAAVAEITARLVADGIKTKALTVSHAFHSPLMKPMLAEYERVVREIRFSAPRVPFVSCVDGRLVSDGLTRPEYWLRQVLDPVRFVSGMQALEAEGVTTCVEIGPAPVLLGTGRQCVSDESSIEWLPSMRKDADPWQTLAGSLARLYADGAEIDWNGFDAPYVRRRVRVPAYPFNEKQYWLPPSLVPRSGEPGKPAAAETSPEAGITGDAEAAGPRLYELAWREQPRADGSRAAGRLAFLIVAEDAAWAGEVARALEGLGAPVRIANGVDSIGRIESARASGTELRIVYLAGHAVSTRAPVALESIERDTRAGVEDVVRLVQTILHAGAADTTLWCVTRGALPVDSAVSVNGGGRTEQPLFLAQAPLWGLGRTIALEHPDLWGALIDLPADASETSTLAAELLASDDRGEDQIALRGAGRYVARLVHGEAAPAGTGFSADARGTYLVTGGLGALGLHAARWLVSKGAKHLVLTGRRGAVEPQSQSSVHALQALGVHVTVAAADVSRAGDVDRLMADIAAHGVPLRGVVHAAGIDASVPLRDLTPADIDAVLAPKVAGSWVLHERTRGLDLDLFVCFSSIASVLGAAGRAHYGAANAFLDALAFERRRLGLPAAAVNWGPWKGGGMASEPQLAAFERIGNRGLAPEQALSSLDVALSTGRAQTAIVDIDWPTFRAAYEARRARPLLVEMSMPGEHATGPSFARTLDVEPADRRAIDQDASIWLSRLRALSPGQRIAELASLLRHEVADTLGFDEAESVQSDKSFYAQGMDSLMMADLVGRLKKRTGMSCSGLVFDHPKIDVLAPVLLERLDLSGGPDSGPEADLQVPLLRVETDIPENDIPENDIFDFQAKAWPHRSPDLIPARWRWMFLDSARRLGLEPRIWLHRDGGRVVGHMGSIPVRVKLGPDERSTAWLVDTMVLQEYRPQAIGSRLMVDAHEDIPFALSLGQSQEMRQIQLRLGWRQVAPLQVAQLLVHPENVLKGKLPAPAAWAAGIGLRASSTVRELVREPSRLEARTIGRFGRTHDALWSAAARDLTCAVVRDASYLNWKYVDQPGQAFLRLEIADGGEIQGVAVWMFREPDRDYAYRRGFLVDLVAPLSAPSLLQQVLRTACDAARAQGVDSLVCMHTDARVTGALRSLGFRLRQPQRFLLVDPGPLEGAALQRVLSAESWFVTQGDSDIDRPW